jgi:hypothetical protein
MRVSKATGVPGGRADGTEMIQPVVNQCDRKISGDGSLAATVAIVGPISIL